MYRYCGVQQNFKNFFSSEFTKLGQTCFFYIVFLKNIILKYIDISTIRYYAIQNLVEYIFLYNHIGGNEHYRQCLSSVLTIRIFLG